MLLFVLFFLLFQAVFRTRYSSAGCVCWYKEHKIHLCYLHICLFPLAMSSWCVCVCVFIFFQFVRMQRKLLLSFRLWRQNGFLKNIPFSSPLCLTSLFHHSAALSRLLWPCLVTAHLCQGVIQSHWWPLGANESKWQNGNGDRAAWTHVSFSTGSHWNYHSHAVICTLRHGILWIRKCVWWPAVSVSLTRTAFAVSQR